MTDTFNSEAEFLRSTATDIVTGEPLYDDARPDLYAIDARRIADRIEALEAENARLREALLGIAKAPETMIWGEDYEIAAAMNRMERLALAAIKGETE